jgi:hypothetical protein
VSASTAVVLSPAEDVVIGAVRNALSGRTFSLDFAETKKEIPVFHGAADPKTPRPYVLVGDSSNALKFNTLGPAKDAVDATENANLGATVRVPIRVITQYPTSQEQTYRIAAPINAAVNGKRFDVPGYGRTTASFENMSMLIATVDGVLVRELFVDVDLALHQTS